MKHFALLLSFAVFLLACPLTTPGQPTTPGQSEPNAKCPDNALLPAELGAPLPQAEAWTGELPPLPSASAAWVLTPADSEEKVWWLFLIDTQKSSFSRVYTVQGKDVGDTVKKLTVIPVNVPRALLAVLSSGRPLPVPGPIGEPDFGTVRAALNAGRGVFWGEQLGIQQPGQKGPQ